MPRRIDKWLTEGQIGDKLRAAANRPSSASELSDVYAGKQIGILTDNGPTLGYRFAGKNRLALSENGGVSTEAAYGALTLGDIVFFTHSIPRTQRGYHVIVDRHTNPATVFEVWFSGWSRVYLVPGMYHCRGGEYALDNFDLLTAVVNWVETGTAPDSVIATGKAFPGRSRPLCAWPKYAYYKGQGDPEEAKNFECRE